MSTRPTGTQTRSRTKKTAAIRPKPKQGPVKRTATGSLLGDLVLLMISAAGMWATFPPVDWWPLAVPSIALLVGLVDRVSPGRAWAYSGLWGMAFFVPHIWWSYVATDGTWIAWLLLSAAQALFIALWGLSFSAMGSWRWARTLWGEAAGGALLWVCFEQIRSRFPFGGFPWGKVAYAQVDAPFIAFAPLGGEVLVSFVVVFVAILIRRVVSVNSSPESGGTVTRLSAAAVALILVIAPALVRLPNAQQTGSVRAAAIQGNVEIPAAQTFAIPRKVTGNHVNQTLAMMQQGEQPEVVFWGENATDIDPRVDSATTELVNQAAMAAGVPMVIGLMEYQGDVRYNLMAVWQPGTGITEELYGKQHPVPWGEYLPLRELTLKLAPIAGLISVDMLPVENPGFIEVTLNDGRVVPIAIGICFEVAYEPIIAEGVQMGGQLILIPTNNSIFQDSPESVQQLQMTRFRAAQFSRSAIQVSTNGVSAMVRPDGSVLSQTEVQEAARLVETLPLRDVITPSAALGELPAQLIMIVGLLLSATSIGAYAYGQTLRRSAKRS